MKPDFYASSKRTNIYNSIFIYKVISMAVAIVLTLALGYLFHRDKALLKEYNNGRSSAFFIGVAVCLVVFVISIAIDFYILHRTISIGKRLNKLAYIDHLTGLPNRYSCDLLLESFNNPQRLPKTGFFLMQLSNLHNINASEGHKNGNYLISEFSSILEDVSENYGFVGRNGGNEYIILLEDCDSTKADLFLLDLTKRIHGFNEMNLSAPIEVFYSRVLNCDENKEKISEIISLGYQKIREMPLTLS